MRSRRRVPGILADWGVSSGDSGTWERDFAEFSPSTLEKLLDVAVDGCDLELDELLSRGYFGKLTPGLTGLVKTGVSAFKNSMYELGGVMGVDNVPSSFFTSDGDKKVPLCISDGRLAVLGVLSG